MPCDFTDSLDHGDGDWFHPFWWWFFFFPSIQHALDAKINGLRGVQPRVVNPQGEERLGNAP